MPENKPMTGYPSIDKPWLKYYSEEAIKTPLPEMTMYQYIWENNKNHLSDIALRYYGTKISYGKLFETIKKVASAFWAMGVRPGDIVTIMSMHTPETIYAIYGLNYIGAVANMVYMTLAEKEILHTIENTESKLFLVLDVALKKMEAIKDKLHIPVLVLGVADSMPVHIKVGYRLKVRPNKNMFMTWQDFLKHSAGEPPMATDHGASAVIVYTSGTTGEPKGAVLSNNSITAVAFQALNAEYHLEKRRRFLDALPPFIGFGITMLHETLAAGLDIHLWIQLEPEAIAEQFVKDKPEFFVTGPAFVDAIIAQKEVDLSHIIYFGGGGGALTEKSERAINDYLHRCHSKTIYANGYGMTESSATLCASTDTINKYGSVGIPLPKTIVKSISLQNQSELPYNEVGELCFSTPSLMKAYYKKPQATESVFITDKNGNRWLRTGDLGYVDKDGFVYIKGRIKRIFITRDRDGTAYKLFPQKIEELICKLDEIETCGVVVLEDQARMHVPVVFAKAKMDSTDDSILEKQVWGYVKTELSEYEQPAAIYLLDSMPMTQSGKIDYRTLEEKAKEKVI